jgi:aconitate hydratase
MHSKFETDVLRVGAHQYTYYPLVQVASKDVREDLPASLCVLLENVLRHSAQNPDYISGVEAILAWRHSRTNRIGELFYQPSRVLMQDFTGVPTVVDLAAMRDAIVDLGGDARKINPHCQVDLVIDHSVQVDVFAQEDAMEENTQIEMNRNQERYALLNWAQSAFENFRVVPPGRGICHQINLEHLAHVVWGAEEGDAPLAFPDTLVGTDSHTTMVNALGVLGWGVGGIEAEAAILGQPISMCVPDVIGVYLTGIPQPGVMATDIVLALTEQLRSEGVVSKFVEFFGPGLAHLSLEDRATIANMAPEFGATCGFFPIDEKTLAYLTLTGRSQQKIDLVEAYAKAQGLWHRPDRDQGDYTRCLQCNLSELSWSLSGPKRPQDRVSLDQLKDTMHKTLSELGCTDPLTKTFPVEGLDETMKQGDVVIAAITSCTNTSNPAVLIAAGLFAKKAVERGLKVKPWVKTSLAPGSRVVPDYLNVLGLLEPLEQLGFHVVGFGCTTCIGNSGPLSDAVASTVSDNDLVVSAVLSGNRNFSGRIHPQVQANWLASPPLVVAFALTGTTCIDLTQEPLGQDSQGQPVMLSELWPAPDAIQAAVAQINSQMFAKAYDEGFWKGRPRWQQLSEALSQDQTDLDAHSAPLFPWEEHSTYIRKPDFLKGIQRVPTPCQDIKNARILAVFGDSVTTDHISPAGAIAQMGPAGQYLEQQSVGLSDFNSYGARRGNHEVMVRGAFANIRIHNHLAPETEGGYALSPAGDEILSIYDAAMKYAETQTPLVVFAGREYGTGSSRDWAAKGTLMLGVKCVIAESFERIHRSNLVGMGVLPCQLPEGIKVEGLKLTGQEALNITGIDHMNQPLETLQLMINRPDGSHEPLELKCCIETLKELAYYQQGGILHYVLRHKVKAAEPSSA